jgi:toxin ParE1/3/4
VKIAWTLWSRTRLLEIVDFVAADDPAAAARLFERLVQRGESLATFPLRGRRVPEMPGSDLRELVDGGYRIVYRVKGSTVEILTVFEGHQLLRNALPS